MPFFFFFFFFFFNDTATTEIYTLSLHDALPIGPGALDIRPAQAPEVRHLHDPERDRDRDRGRPPRLGRARGDGGLRRPLQGLRAHGRPRPWWQAPLPLRPPVRRERAGRPEGRGGRRPGDGGRFGRGRSRALLRDALPGTAGGSAGVAGTTRPRRALAAAAILAILPS